ncbi:MAG TPA: acetyl-CoA carboxylase biotin carboxyl carrier protein [Longimicrobiales bacterium]|nr:acetyl-CoA carboxylase biotin carboxyl carrier protein [Longimicrobiales bacterium]
MIDLEFLERLIKAIDQSSLDSIEIERGGTRLRLSKTAPQAPATTASAAPAGQHGPPPAPQAPSPAGPASAPASPSRSHLLEVTSPMVGTFYGSPTPDAPPYVEKGKRVSKGDTLCIIEAMKLMNELECEVEGTIVEVLAERGQPVEFGQVLFRVDPA